MHREMGNPGLAESLLPKPLGHNGKLEKISEMVEWGRFEELVSKVYSAREGRPSYPPLTMVKVLLLEQWYNLSDTEMEEALGDRISFRRFVGLGLQDDTPDHSTISRFRTALEEGELSEKLFNELGKQLERLGVVLKQGTLMDATLVEAQVKRPSMSAGGGAKNPLDPDAEWSGGRVGRRSHFGYKVHVGVDAGSGVVRRAKLTSARVYESAVADGLVSCDEAEVYGDRAYESRRRREWLKSLGIGDMIMHRSHKHQKELPEWQKKHNEEIGPKRALVEKVFGTLKRSYGYGRVRYRGLERNALEMWFKLMAYNLRKMVQLSAAHPV